MYVFREKKMETFQEMQMKAMTEKGERKIKRKERTEKIGLLSTCVRMMTMIRLSQKMTGRKRNGIPNRRALLLGIYHCH